MPWRDPVLIGGVVGSIAAAVVSVINARTANATAVAIAAAAAEDRRLAREERLALTHKTEQLTDVVVKNDEKTDDLTVKLQEVHTLTNSNLTKVSSALEVATAQIAGLERLVTQMKAEVHETNGAVNGTVEKKLDSIEKTGEDTNVKVTDAPPPLTRN